LDRQLREAREIHQIDILHIGAIAEMLHKPPEDRGLELGARKVVNFLHAAGPFAVDCAWVSSIL
jgi:hypothetical protein